jgi:hypothetical protein
MFDDEEKANIAALRHRLNDILHDIKHDENSIEHTYIQDDSTLWRFIMGKSLEENPMDAAEEMLRSHLIWRKEINLDKIMTEWRSKENKPVTARAVMGDLCYYGKLMSCQTINNGPVLYERIGKTDFYGLFQDSCMYK